MRSIPASVKSSRLARSVTQLITDGPETLKAAAPLVGMKGASRANRLESCWVHQPASWGRSVWEAKRLLINIPPAEPGPAHRYLYEHQTAKSTSGLLSTHQGEITQKGHHSITPPQCMKKEGRWLLLLAVVLVLGMRLPFTSPRSVGLW